MAAVEPTLAAALVAAQAKMPAVAKDGENPHYKSKFVSLDALIEATRKVLNDHGLAMVQFPAVSELGQPTLRTILVHGPSGEQLTADMPLLGADQNMQQLGSAITYGRRYAWSSVLGIASEEDNDGEAPPAPAAAVSSSQHAMHNAMLNQLQKQQPRGADEPSWTDLAREFIRTRYGQTSRSLLTADEMSALIRWTQWALDDQIVPPFTVERTAGVPWRDEYAEGAR